MSEALCLQLQELRVLSQQEVLRKKPIKPLPMCITCLQGAAAAQLGTLLVHGLAE